jgi:hypothetical protein
VAELPGFTRVWGVAMDNRRDLPGYKYYTRPGGCRPAVHVAFLDLLEIEPAAAGAPGPANGVCLPVDNAALARLDARERNYRRVDVSERLPGAPGRVWTYIGSVDGRERLARGRRLGTAVIDAGYLGVVRARFRALGDAEFETARDSLRPGELPVVELVRHVLA